MSSEYSFSEPCIHDETETIDGVVLCVKCGFQINETFDDIESHYYGSSDTRYKSDPGRHNYRGNDERSLYNDLDVLGFPPNIIEKANEYYKNIIENKIYRAKNRLSIVFACTFHAHETENVPFIPYDLAKQFKISRKKMSHGLKIYSKIFKKRPDKKYITALDIVPNILQILCVDKVRMQDCLDDIKYIYDYISTTSRVFNCSSPQTIAAGIVYYYLLLNNIFINKVDFSIISHLTDVTFTKIANEIKSRIGEPFKA